MAQGPLGNCQLQNLLDARGITPAEFARRIGWSSRMVYHWCNNQRKMSLEAVYAASQFLGVPMEALYDWNKPSKKAQAERQ